MRNKYFLSFILVLVTLAGCRKYDLAGEKAEGEGLGEFTLKAPSNNTSLVLNSAIPGDNVVIEWNPAQPGVKTAPTYKWIAALKTGLLDQPVLEFPSDSAGKFSRLTLTQKAIDDALKAKGIADGAIADLKWSVIADNGSAKLRASDSFNISITRFGDGVSPFVVFGPLSSTNEITINPGSRTDFIKFNWQKSNPGKPANAVTYKVLLAKEGESFSAPLFQFNSAHAGSDTTLSLSYFSLDSALTAHNMSQSEIAKLQWTVIATSGSFSKTSEYINKLYILREVKLFIVGGSSPAGWSPPDAIQLIGDVARPGIFYMYTRLTIAGDGFKFLSENTDWNTPSQKIYGDADASGTTGSLIQSGGSNNIKPTDGDGIYRVTVDLANNKYYVQKQFGRMGLVGGGTVAGWDPPGVFPAQEMGWISTNLFLGITSITSGGEFKLIDNNDWPNGSVTYTRDYEDGLNGKLREDGGPNFKWEGTTGQVRVTWDVRDMKNPKYLVSPAIEMRVVGNGMNGVPEWNPGASPAMTYAGKGKWTITLDLVAGKEIKFLAGNDWGAFDYEDAGNGKIKWDGADNFKTPLTSGTYNIVLDEYSGTYTIR